MKLYCADDRCRYCNDDHVCTSETVELVFEGLHTVHQGFREVHTCKTFEKSNLYKQVEEFMRGRIKQNE